MIDYIVLSLFMIFMVFMVRGFVVQMINKNKMRDKLKVKKERNDKRIID
ncbi:MAG: hypothetical protein ACTTJC_00370 [Campylobacter sp.]